VPGEFHVDHGLIVTCPIISISSFDLDPKAEVMLINGFISVFCYLYHILMEYRRDNFHIKLHNWQYQLRQKYVLQNINISSIAEFKDGVLIRLSNVNQTVTLSRHVLSRAHIGSEREVRIFTLHQIFLT
jgi:hypothetical protein